MKPRRRKADPVAPPRPYHHGDLRRALLDAGLQLLATRSADDLALREVARTVGVSPTAIYRHFPDKQALMSGLAAEGLAQLAQVQAEARAAAGDAAAGFLASGLAYVRFAAEQPVLFQLTFTHAAALDVLEARPSEVSAAMRELRADVDRLVPAGTSPAARKALALHAWALVHGLAQLVLQQQIAPDWALVERVLRGAEAVVRAAGPAGPPTRRKTAAV
ncbi:MAG: TetR/AcrR family transcriptional regulator [Aquabacterium sp.]